MRKDDIASLIKESTSRSDTARLKDVFDDVERAISSGVSLAEIHERLLNMEFRFSIHGFKQALARIRKRKKEAALPDVRRNETSVTPETHTTVECDNENNTVMEVLSSDKKVRREQLAGKFFTPEAINPILNKTLKKDK